MILCRWILSSIDVELNFELSLMTTESWVSVRVYLDYGEMGFGNYAVE